MSNKVECLGFGGECECGCDCCMGTNTAKCDPGTDHPVARDHSTAVCPQSKATLYKTGMVHEA